MKSLGMEKAATKGVAPRRPPARPLASKSPASKPAARRPAR
jgi:hypothetical protein